MSLNDMAAKRAADLHKLNAFRRRISDVLKRHYPAGHTAAERALGHRLVDADDDVILAYLENLLDAGAVPPATTEAAPAHGTDLLRNALRNAGFPIGDDDDLTAWAQAVSRNIAAGQAADRADTPAVAPDPRPATHAPDTTTTPVPSHDPAPVAAPTASAGTWDTPVQPDDDSDLVDLFGSAPAAPATDTIEDFFATAPDTAPAVDHETPASSPADEIDDLFATPPASSGDTDDLVDLFGDNGPPASSPADEIDDLFTAPSGDVIEDFFATPAAPPAPAVDEIDDLFAPAATDSGVTEPPADGWAAVPAPPDQDSPVDEIDDLFTAPSGDVVDDFFTAAPSGDSDDLVDLFGDTPAPTSAPADTATPSSTSAPAGDDLVDLFGDTPAAAPSTATAGNDAPSDSDDLVDLFGDTPAPTSTPADTANAPAGEPASPEKLFGEPAEPSPRADGWGTPDSVISSPLRPEIVPTRTSRRKPPRSAKAAAPDPRRDLADDNDPVDIPDDIDKRLRATVTIPRPVFLPELDAVAGSREVADAWVQANLNKGAASPIRIVRHKPRHKMLGSLVFPAAGSDLRVAATEFNRTPWAQVIDKYRAAPLYELAVLLSRVGESVQSVELFDDVVRLRLSEPRGLVGLIVHLRGNLGAGSRGRSELVSAVDGFMSERFTLLGVVTAVAGPKALESLIDTVRDEAEAAGWDPPYPVVATHSWEWGSGSNHPTRLVLGD